MPNKKKPIFSFKELLFAYLAISKLMYWTNNIVAIQQSGISGILYMIVSRLLAQDIMTIWILIVMFYLEYYIETHPAISKGLLKSVLLYIIGYVLYVASIVTYMLILGLFIDVQISSWADVVVHYSIFYLIACVVLNLKGRMKKKEAEIYILEEKANEDTLVLLSALHERGVLTLEEYESKKARLSDSHAHT